MKQSIWIAALPLAMTGLTPVKFVFEVLVQGGPIVVAGDEDPLVEIKG